MQFRTLVFAALSILGSTQALAATAEQCTALRDAYEDQLKMIDSTDADHLMATNHSEMIARDTKRSFFASMAQLNLSLLQANACPLPVAPAKENTYLSAAMDCKSAYRKAYEKDKKSGANSSGMPPECERANWKRKAEK